MMIMTQEANASSKRSSQGGTCFPKATRSDETPTDTRGNTTRARRQAAEDPINVYFSFSKCITFCRLPFDRCLLGHCSNDRGCRDRRIMDGNFVLLGSQNYRVPHDRAARKLASGVIGTCSQQVWELWRDFRKFLLGNYEFNVKGFKRKAC